MRYAVQDTYRIPGRGPVVSGLLLEGEVRSGETLTVEETGAPVRVVFVDFHTLQTDQDLVVGLQLHPEDAPAVIPGSTLVSRAEV